MATLTPTTFILDKTAPGPAHVVIGRDYPAQVRFLQEILGEAEIIECPKLTDAVALGRLGAPGAFIFLLGNERHLDVSVDVRARIRVWEATAIRKDSSAINAVLRHAMEMLGVQEITKQALKTLGARVVNQCGEDGDPTGMVWAAAWHLTDPELGAEEVWKHPWETPWNWVNKAPLPARLHLLYRDLAAWVFSRDDDKKAAERIGVSPSKFQWLKQVRLDEQKVDRALVELSAWRSHIDDGYTTALRIGAIFQG